MNTYLWDFGDGTTSTEENPAHTYEAEGTYTVTLTVDNGYSRATTTKEAYIVVETLALPTVVLRVGAEVEFDAEYTSYAGSTVTPLTETGWDEVNVNVPSGPTFDGSRLDWTDYSEQNAVRTTSPFSGSGYSCVEFVVNVLPPSNYLTIGSWEEGFGPSWDPNTGTPTVPCLWVSDGRTITYGGTNFGGPTFTDGDVIGVVRNVSGGNLLFFKNGVYVQTLSTNASTQWPIVSLVGDPS